MGFNLVYINDNTIAAIKKQKNNNNNNLIIINTENWTIEKQFTLSINTPFKI